MNIAAFEQRLLTRKHELDARLNRIENDLEQAHDQDVEDHAIEVENDEVLEGLGKAGQDELRAIDAAISRIKAGTFGTCPKCGQKIAPARLEAVPHAALCQECIGQ